MGVHRRTVLLLLLVTLCHNVFCQVPFPRKCPEVNVVASFDLDKYMGVWYEYSKYPFFWEVGQKCQYFTYKNNGNGTVSVKNTGTFAFANKSNTIQEIGKVIAPGKLAVSFRNQSSNEPNYLLLGTDYDNWAVVYSCNSVSSFAHTKVIWILSRQRLPSDESIKTAMNVVKNNNLNEDFLIQSTQTDCPDVTSDGSDEEMPSADADQPNI